MGDGCSPGSAATPFPSLLCGTPHGAAFRCGLRAVSIRPTQAWLRPARSTFRPSGRSGCLRHASLVRRVQAAGLRAGWTVPSRGLRSAVGRGDRPSGLSPLPARREGSTVLPSLRPSGRTSPVLLPGLRGAAAALAPQRGGKGERPSEVETQESIGLPRTYSARDEQRTRLGEQCPEVEASPATSADVLDRATERVAKRFVAPPVRTRGCRCCLGLARAHAARRPAQRHEGTRTSRGVTAPGEGKALKGRNSMSAPA
jgi:hypothetical protein